MEEAAVCALAMPINLTGSEVQKLIDDNGLRKSCNTKRYYTGQKKM